jgi:CDP-diacylglycerol--serine O-phosphatidyltransferase
LRTISTLPTLLTLGNLLCGFAAVHFCLRAMGGSGLTQRLVAATAMDPLPERVLPSFLSIAATFIFLGLLMDALDGSVARWTKRASDFGGQLDSLADVVTFGIAPAIMIVAVLQTKPEMAGRTGPLSGDLLGRAMWVMVATYVACAALRLARFNVEHATSSAGHTAFHGLPSPGAAVVVASLMLLHEHVRPAIRPYLAETLPFVALAMGLLMVSRVRYVHLANTYLRGRRPFGQVVALVFVLGLFWWYKELTLAVVVCAYALSGPLLAIVGRLRRVRTPAAATGQADPDQPAATRATDAQQQSA